ncbi:MAG: polyprenyl synthetase family protein [Endomicrobiia bacterium]
MVYSLWHESKSSTMLQHHLNRTGVDIKQIYEPISKELSDVEIELKKQINSMVIDDKDVNEIVSYFFSVSGKRLRPALVLLSAKSVNHKLSRPEQSSGTPNHKLISLATAVELIHSASLIHDDIIDQASFRRNQPSMNKQFGDKLAVLLGDLLYTRAFLILVNKFDNRILKILSKCVENMCYGEISEQQILQRKINKQRITFEEYSKVLEAKTASFMSACCQCGAILAQAEEEIFRALKDYGFNVGMAYQIVDDCVDNDSVGISNINHAKEFAFKAKQSIEVLPNSIYKEKLFDLVDYILNQNDKL